MSSIAASAWSGGETSTHYEAVDRTFTTQHAGISGALGLGKSTTAMIAFGTVTGGASAELAGGNFWMGAASGFMVSYLNHAMHPMENEGEIGFDRNGHQVNNNGGDDTDYMYDDNGKVMASTAVYRGELPMFGDDPSTVRSYGFKRISGVIEEDNSIFEAYASGKIIGAGMSYLTDAFTSVTGGLKQWIRYGDSYSPKGGFATKGIRWGAGGNHFEKIGNQTLRGWNQSLRQMKLPGNSWRVQDPGHFHFIKY